MKIIDLRSDTVTQPTEEMRRAMAEAVVGDDVFGEDPTINKLEEMSAELMGKEAGIFVPTGTMGNQIGIMAQTTPGDEIIAGTYSHIIENERGGFARLSGVSTAQIDNPDCKIYPEDIKNRTRSPRLNHPTTSLLCLENALANGDVVELELMKKTFEKAKENELSVHLDGARIFNAAVSLGVSPKEIAQYSDSVMFCISKGLCAPVGSLLCGTKEFVDKARKCRKMLGGGMRQAGVLASAGIISLEKMVGRLAVDHDNAKLMGSLLSEIPEIAVALDNIKINMIYWNCENPNFNEEKFAKTMKEKGIIVLGAGGGHYRFVLHNDITTDDVHMVAREVKGFFATV